MSQPRCTPTVQSKACMRWLSGRGHSSRACSSRADGQVAGEVLGRLGEAAGAWLDRGTEHPHRIALSVRGDRAGDAAEQLRAGFEAAGVQARPWGWAL